MLERKTSRKTAVYSGRAATRYAGGSSLRGACWFARLIAGTDLYDNRNRAVLVLEQLQYALYVMFIEPINHKAIRRKQAQGVRGLNGLQRTNPGVELLLWQLRLEFANTVIPESRFSLQRGSQEKRKLF